MDLDRNDAHAQTGMTEKQTVDYHCDRVAQLIGTLVSARNPDDVLNIEQEIFRHIGWMRVLCTNDRENSDKLDQTLHRAYDLLVTLRRCWDPVAQHEDRLRMIQCVEQMLEPAK